jgi:hypothetical protein
MRAIVCVCECVLLLMMSQAVMNEVRNDFEYSQPHDVSQAGQRLTHSNGQQFCALLLSSSSPLRDFSCAFYGIYAHANTHSRGAPHCLWRSINNNKNHSQKKGSCP